MVSYSLTVAAQSLFLILQLFNCFTSARTGLHSFPLSLPLFNSPSLSLYVQSSLLAPKSVMLVVFGRQQPRPSLWTITAHQERERSERAGRERGREMGTELRDGVRYKNVKRRRMLNDTTEIKRWTKKR